MSARYRIRTYDEFDDLIEAFNTMGEELAQSSNTVQQTMQDLSGFLPIYCSCKKIRDDEGYRQQVEKFVQDRTNARFTHGFCPDWVTELYGSVLLEENGPE